MKVEGRNWLIGIRRGERRRRTRPGLNTAGGSGMWLAGWGRLDRAEGDRVRVRPVMGLLLVLMAVVVLRLAYLQIWLGDNLAVLAEKNSYRVEVIPAERGRILDRKGEVLAETEAGQRRYPARQVLAQVVGYVGKPNAQVWREWQACKEEYCRYLTLDDKVGLVGLERVWDRRLRGKNGYRVVQKDSRGKTDLVVSQELPVRGDDLVSSLDLGLSRVAMAAMDSRAGAVVVSSAKDNRVMVMVSSPSFNPNAVVSGGEGLQELWADESQPMFNRAIGGLYPPGSTFKIVTAAAGLETGEIYADSQIEDTGEIKVGGVRFGSWYYDNYGRTEGKVNIVKALKRSNDVFFYRLGEKVGPTRLAGWAEKFGLGRLSGFEIGGEAAGLVPSPDWKLKERAEKWFLGDTYNLAIGQGDLLVTPWQVNQISRVIASGGEWCPPSFDSVGEVAGCRELGLRPETIALVREGMVEACSPGGTAFPLFGFKPQLACKTGTAEFTSQKGETAPTHAWLTAFAPADNPEVVVTVLLEGAGEGSAEAAPVVKEVLNYYFQRQAAREGFSP